jgi:hypothetical protein
MSTARLHKIFESDAIIEKLIDFANDEFRRKVRVSLKSIYLLWLPIPEKLCDLELINRKGWPVQHGIRL